MASDSEIPELFFNPKWHPVTKDSKWNPGDVVVFLLDCDRIVTLDCVRYDEELGGKYVWDDDNFTNGEIYGWNPFDGCGGQMFKALFYVTIKTGKAAL